MMENHSSKHESDSKKMHASWAKKMTHIIHTKITLNIAIREARINVYVLIEDMAHNRYLFCFLYR